MRAELLIIRPRFLLGVASAILFTAVSLFLSLSLSQLGVPVSCVIARMFYAKVHRVIGIVD